MVGWLLLLGVFGSLSLLGVSCFVSFVACQANVAFSGSMDPCNHPYVDPYVRIHMRTYV